MAQYVMSMLRVSKIVPPKRQIIKDISLSFFPGAKIGLLGLNGSGKSTVLRIMANADKEYDGEVQHQPNIRIGYLPQEPQLHPDKTVREEVEASLGEVMQARQKLEEVYAAYAEPDADFDKLAEEQNRLEAIISAAGTDAEQQMEIAADALRLPAWDAVIGKLSGGEKRRVALCKLLLEKPDMLLLDEPTNHLDAESVEWLEQFLVRFPGTVVAVTHDRYFLDNVAGWILELDHGKAYPWEGNYSGWLEQKQKRLILEEKTESKRQRTLDHELAWIRLSPRARQAKGKARLNAYEQMLAEDSAQKIDRVEIYIPPGPRLGDVVIEARDLKKGYGDILLMDDLNFTLPRGGIVGVIGPNGAGKTTLFRLIIGAEQPDAGELRVGPTVKIAHVDQSRDSLPDGETIWQAISGGEEIMKLSNREVNSRAYCAQFGFTGADQSKKVGVLSGGERNRVHLARLLKSGANLILLDEPTNDLDVNSIRALEEGLENFAGCAVVVSHDRWFLDRVATHILAFEGDSTVHWFSGNFSSYQEDLRRRKGKEADQPHRIKYRKLTRH